MRTKSSDQSLGNRQSQCGGNEEWLNPHVNQSGDRPCRRIGMKRTEHQMARQCCFDGHICCLRIADFSNHDHIGIITQDRPQCFAETHFIRRVDRHLCDPVHLVFHGIFHRHNVQRACRNQFFQCGVERGALAATGWARQQHQTMRSANRRRESRQIVRVHSQLRKRQILDIIT